MTGGKVFAARATIARQRSKMSVRSQPWASPSRRSLSPCGAIVSASATCGSRNMTTRPAAFCVEALEITEVDADGLMVAKVDFDPDDIDAAFEELDARYLAGEAAADAHTWSVIARARATLARHELPPTTPDWVNLDHRRGIAFQPGDMTAYIRAYWDLEQDFSTYIEAVHRLNHLGAVFTQVARGTSQAGFDAEWRVVELMTVQGDLINRAEFFDEADLDAALARFEELSQPARRLENAASRAYERFQAFFAARDWDAMAEMLADDATTDDRRPVVNAGYPTRPGCRNREHAGDRRCRGKEHDVPRHRDPRRAPRPESLPLLGARPAARGVPHRGARHRRDRHRQSDRGARHVRPRRHRRRLRGTRRPIPRRRSGRPRAHVVGHRAGLRRIQPTRTPRDDTGLGEHRPPTRRQRSRPAT